MLRNNAKAIPGPIPNLTIIIGTSNGKSIAPAKGVKATNNRNIIN